MSPDVFVGANYVALGHLHRAQTAGAAHIRYSGSPMAFGFDEASAEKSMTLIDIDGAGAATVELIPFRPLRGVRVVEGLFADVLKQPPSDDFVRLVLADREPIIDAMKRIRVIYPNVCELAYRRDLRAPEIKSQEGSVASRAEPLDFVDEFLTFVRGAGADTKIGGQPVRKGDKIYVSYAAANRDPAVFEDPHLFDITRANAKRHLAFCTGPHVGIGARLARMQLRALLKQILLRIPGIHPVGEPEWLRSIWFNEIIKMPVALTPERS